MYETDSPSVGTHTIVMAELLYIPEMKKLIIYSVQIPFHLQSKPNYIFKYKEIQTIFVICNLSVKSTNICFNDYIDLFGWSSFIYSTVFRCFGVRMKEVLCFGMGLSLTLALVDHSPDYVPPKYRVWHKEYDDHKYFSILPLLGLSSYHTYTQQTEEN